MPAHTTFHIDHAVSHQRRDVLNYLTIGILLVMLPLYVQQQLHLSDLLIGIAVGSQFIATLLTRGAAGRKADTSGGRRTVITGQFYCAASGLLMLVSLIAHPVPLLAWAILIVGRAAGHR